MNYIKVSASFLILLALVIALNTKFGSVPPLGKFFDPDAGFWANAEISEQKSVELDIAGLKEEVSVYYDERHVPHIFAQNEHDLYLAQGYIVARDRLFQMEMQTYDAAGRLAEIVGPLLLNRDLQTRRWGMSYGAEKAMEQIEKDPEVLGAITAYSDGINAWIDQLSPANYPLEYKVLDFSPEEWKPIKAAYLLKSMTRLLAARGQDAGSSNTLAYFGEDFVEKLFTRKPELNEPIIPPSREWDFEADIPEAPDSLYVPASARNLEPFFDTPEGIGSNNWAVSGDKTASGYPILSNDPHLPLTLPSIWYEVQLNAPGINTYGVSLQGAPGIILGFNEKTAWGTTNVGADVLDRFEIRFRDEQLKEYWHNGEWKPTTYRVEEIKVRGEKTVMDTVVYTHHGPVTKIEASTDESGAVYQALRWIAHEPSNDLKTFLGFNKAENYTDFEEAVKHYVAPAQNFAFATQQGDIAMWVSGKLPKKWKFQGRTVSDGTDARYDWHGWIPTEHNPHILNPERGFVSSANQESAAPDYPYYLSDDFAPYERGRRINELLVEMANITPQDMQNMQMDNFGYNAATIIPELLEWVDQDVLSAEEQEIIELLEEWDFHMEGQEIAPAVYLNWFNNFYRAVFSDEYESAGARLRYPSRDIFVEVIKEEPDFEFIDDINTAEKETRRDIALTSFRKTINEMTQEYGEFGENWKWGYVMDNDIHHLANIPGLGMQNLFSSGAAEAINATRGTHGPSWRMVVELGPEVKGWGVYPGGQSGNPGSPNYDNMIEGWRTGKLFELNFMKTEPDQFSYKLKLNAR